jgi:hypothetical protein
MTTGHPEDDDRAAADRVVAIALLRRAGLAPPDSELAAVLDNYVGFGALTASLYGVPGTRHELPAIRFSVGDQDDTTPESDR